MIRSTETSNAYYRYFAMIYEYFPEMDDYTWVGQLEDIEITVF